ncbi:MAG: tetratricopeptide repeat protein [Pseudomonadota bacterium]
MKMLFSSLAAGLLVLSATAAAAQQTNPRILLLDAQALSNRGQDEQALVLLDQVVQSEALSDQLRAIAYAQRGNIHYRAKRYPIAQQDFAQGLTFDARSLPALRGNCFSLLQMRRHEEAGGPCTAAADRLVQNGQVAAAADILGYAAFMRRDYGTALEELNTAIRLDPAYAPAYLHRGLVYQAQKNEVLARQDFLKARELWPGDREIEATLRQLGLLF